MKIVMKERFGEYCLHHSEGEEFAYILKTAMSSRDVSEFDFFGIRLASSFFLESAFFNITKTYSVSKIFSKIKFKCIKDNIRDTIIFTVEHLHQYHKNQEYRNNMDSVNLVGNKAVKEEVGDLGGKIKKSEKRSKDKKSDDIPLQGAGKLDVKFVSGHEIG